MYLFVLWLVGIIGSLFIGGLSIFFFGIRPQTKKIIEESKRLTLKMNQLKSEIGTGGREDFVSNALAEGGIDGLIDSLGLPAIVKPFAKGLIDSYLSDPKKLQALAERFGVKIPEGKNGTGSGGEKIELL